MKRLALALVVVASLAIPAVAQIQIGAVGLLNAATDINGVQNINLEDLTPNDFLYGAEARLSLGMLEGSATAIYQPGYTWQDQFGYSYSTPATVYAFLDGGLGIDLLGLVRVGAEAGLNYLSYVDDSANASDAIPLGVNLRVLGTVSLFGLSVGVSGTILYDSFEQLLSQASNVGKQSFFLGVHALLTL